MDCIVIRLVKTTALLRCFVIGFTLISAQSGFCESDKVISYEPMFSEHFSMGAYGLELKSPSASPSNSEFTNDHADLLKKNSLIQQIGGKVESIEFTQSDFQPPPLYEDEPACEEITSCSERSQLELFLGLEGSKQPQDFGVNAHFGSRMHANLGIQLFEDSNLGFQIGTAVNLTKHAVRVTSQIDGASSRTQSFTTVGLFQRNERVSWAVVFDYLYQDDYATVSLSQLRMQSGFALNDKQEVGGFFMFPTNEADADWAGVPVTLEPLAQGAIYFRQTWDHAAETTFWLGAAEGHGQVNAALGDTSDTNIQMMFGSDIHIPLNQHVAFFGQANFIMPSDTGTVDAFLGFAFYPGGNAYGWRKQQHAPVLPVANNTSFAVDLDR